MKYLLNHQNSYAFYSLFEKQFKSINELLSQGKIEKKYESKSGNTLELKVNSSDIYVINGYRKGLFDYFFSVSTEKKVFVCTKYGQKNNFDIDYNEQMFVVYQCKDTICIDIFRVFEFKNYIDNTLEFNKEREFDYFYINQENEKKDIHFLMRFSCFESFRINLSCFLKDYSFSYEEIENILESKTHFEKISNFCSFKKNDKLYFLAGNRILLERKYNRFGNNFSEEGFPYRDDLFSSEKSHYRLGSIEFDGQGFFWKRYLNTINAFYENKYQDSENNCFYCEYELEKINAVDFFQKFEKYREDAKYGCNKKAEAIIEDRKKAAAEKKEFLDFLSQFKNENLTLDDAYRAGNCKIGVENFIKKYNFTIENNKIMVRDIILNENINKIIENEDFRRTVRMAFKKK